MTPDPNQNRISELMLGNERLTELSPFFSNQEELLKSYAGFMAGHFPPGKAVHECESCQRRSAEFRTALIWRGIYFPTGSIAATILLGLVSSMVIRHPIVLQRYVFFTTTHGLCGDCLRRIRTRRILGKVVGKICLFAIVLSIMLCMPFPCILALKPTAAELMIPAACFCGGAILLFSGLIGANKSSLWCVPKALKFVSKKPFKLQQVKQVGRLS